MTETTLNTYINGIDKDTNPSKVNNISLFHLENARILSGKNSTVGNIENVEGNKLITIVDKSSFNYTNFLILDYKLIRDDIVVFYYGSASYSQFRQGSIALLKRIDDYTFWRYNLYSNEQFEILPNQHITIITNYESSNVQKVYWCLDNRYNSSNVIEKINSLQHLNIAPSGDEFIDSSYNSVRNTPYNQTLILPLTDYNPIYFSTYGSGYLKEGSIQYAYRLYNLHGTETRFSPPSALIPTSQSINRSSIELLKGADPDQPTTSTTSQNAFNSGRSIIFTLDLSDSNSNEIWNSFDRIEFIRIYYNAFDAIPEISIIDRLPIKKTYTIIDEGENKYGALIYEEYLELKNEFNTYTIEQKNQRIFAGNITEQNFDVDYDARAYRFDSTGLCTLYDGDGNVSHTFTYADLLASPLTVAETADAINNYNDITEDFNSRVDCKYNKDGNVLGGTGLNIEYKLIVEQFESYSTDLADRSLTGNITAVNRDYILGIKRSFQADEIYRCGIVFYNNKGQSSYVKWIGDIRMLSHKDVSLTETRDGRLYLTHYYPQFIVNKIPQNDDGSLMSYQIVYCERREYDRTILYSGLCGGLVYDPAVDDGIKETVQRLTTLDEYENELIPAGGSHGEPQGKLVHQYTLEAISPELNFNYQTYDPEYLDITSVEGRNVLLESDSPTQAFSVVTEINSTHTDSFRYLEKIYNHRAIDKFRLNILDSTLRTPATDMNAGGRSVIGEYLTRWYGLTRAASPHYSSRNTGLLLAVDSIDGTIPTTTTYPEYMYFQAKKANIQYNGNTYTDRLSNTYVAASDISSNLITTCYYGDTFVGVYDYLRIQIDPVQYEDDDHLVFQHIMYFVCESSINLFLRTDNCYSRVFREFPYNEEYLGEEGLISSDKIALLQLEQTVAWTPLYKYNAVHSKSNDTQVFYAKPLDYVDETTFPTKVWYSDKKISGEERDSWLRYRVNNYNTANNQYNEIVKLQEFENEIYVFQNNAVSIAQIDPQVLQVTNTGAPVVIGDGAVLPRFEYIITNCGLQKNNNIVRSINALYWIDIYRKKLYTLAKGKGVYSLSDARGLEGYLRYALKDKSILTGVYDSKYSEVVLTVQALKRTEFVRTFFTPATATIKFVNTTAGSTVTMNIAGQNRIFTAGTSNTKYTFNVLNQTATQIADNFKVAFDLLILDLGVTSVYSSKVTDNNTILTGNENFNVVVVNNISISQYNFIANGGSNIYIFDETSNPELIVTSDNTTAVVTIVEPGMPDKFDMYVDYGSGYVQVAASSMHTVNLDGKSSNFGYPNNGTFYAGAETYTAPGSSAYDTYFPCVPHSGTWRPSNNMHTALLTSSERHWFLGMDNKYFSSTDNITGTCVLNTLHITPAIPQRINEFCNETGYTIDELNAINTNILNRTVNYGTVGTAPRWNTGHPEYPAISTQAVQLMWIDNLSIGDKVKIKVSGCTSGANETGWEFKYFTINKERGETQSTATETSTSSYTYDIISRDSIIDALSDSTGNILTVEDSGYFDIEENSTFLVEGQQAKCTSKTTNSLTFNKSFVPNTGVDLSRYGLYNNNFTIVYSEKIDRFTQFYSFLPDLYINLKDSYLTTEDRKKLWIHNDSSVERGSYYDDNGVANTEVKIEFYINVSEKTANRVKEWNNFEWVTELYDEHNRLMPNVTIDSIRCKNDYQQTDEVLLYPITSDEEIALIPSTELPSTSYIRRYLYTNGDNIPDPDDIITSTTESYRLGNINRVVDHWIGMYPRINKDNYVVGWGDYDDTDYDDVDYYIFTPNTEQPEGVADRLRSPYIKLTLYFNNRDNIRFILNDIITKFEHRLL